MFLMKMTAPSSVTEITIDQTNDNLTMDVSPMNDLSITPINDCNSFHNSVENVTQNAHTTPVNKGNLSDNSVENATQNALERVITPEQIMPLPKCTQRKNTGHKNRLKKIRNFDILTY